MIGKQRLQLSEKRSSLNNGAATKISNKHEWSPTRNPEQLDDQGLKAEKATTELCPPNPNEFEMAEKTYETLMSN